MPQENSRSFRALDTLNFCNAGIQTGLGPFCAIFYAAVRHWNPGQIGILIACQQLAGIAIQPAVGHLVDESKHKRLLTAVAAAIVALGAAGIALLPQFGLQILVELTIGAAVTVFPPATAAFALGLVEENAISQRVARNETFTHAGNVVFAVIAGVAGTFLALASIFYGAAAFALGMAGAVWFIEGVSDEAARRGGGKEGEKEQARAGFLDLMRDKRVLAFAAAVVLFNISNAATLPLVGQILSKGHNGKSSAWEIALAVAVAEIVMVGTASASGKLAESRGRKPLLIVAFAFLALRNGLTVVSHNPWYLISLQALDGVAAGIYGVLLTLVTADLARGTGRFNFLQGTLQSAMGFGGFMSNITFGWVAKGLGFNASFLGLSAIGVAGGIFSQLRMPETHEPGGAQDKDESDGSAAA
jgi:MFS family permease